jgi:hypothetical protein
MDIWNLYTRKSLSAWIPSAKAPVPSNETLNHQPTASSLYHGQVFENKRISRSYIVDKVVSQLAGCSRAIVEGAMKVSHPYYPVDVEIPGYLANEWPFTTLLALFGSACASIIASAWAITKAVRPDHPRFEVLTVLWFVLCEYRDLRRFSPPQLMSINIRRIDSSPF